MKKILFVLMACALCLGLVGGAFAAFSDTETSSGNTFTAGTLDLKVDTDPTSGETWADDPLPNINSIPALNALVNNMKPGDSISGDFGIKNAGTIVGKADFKLTITADVDNGQNEPELAAGDDADNVGELAANVDVVLNYNGTNVYTGTLAGLSGVNKVAPVNLAGGATASWDYTISIAAGVGNIIQSDSVTFNIEFSLNQAP